MADFIAEVIGQNKTSEGNVVTVRMTGFGASDGPLMTRAKARAIVTSTFGPTSASFTRVSDVEGQFGLDREEITALKDKSLFRGPASGVRDRLQAFRRSGLFAEVKKTKPLKTNRVVASGTLEDKFGNLASVVNTYEYDILVTTKFAIN